MVRLINIHELSVASLSMRIMEQFYAGIHADQRVVDAAVIGTETSQDSTAQLRVARAVNAYIRYIMNLIDFSKKWSG